MKRIAAALALAAALAASAPAPAQEAKPAPAAEEKPATLDERYYRAFYLENGLRDFEKANKAYADLAAAAAQEGKKDLQVKCLLGRVRCLRTMQKTEEAGKVADETLRLDPENAEAKALAAGGGSGDGKVEDLDKRIQTLVAWLEGGNLAASMYELRIVGDRAVPYLAKSLRRRDLTAVISVARFLAYHSTAASRTALLEALRDPETVYAVAIAEAVCHPELGNNYRAFENEDLPLLEEVAKRPEVDLRLKVLFRLSNDSGKPETITDLVLRLVRDADPRVRVQVLRAEWPAGILRSLVPALRTALASSVPEEKAAAAVATSREAEVLRSLLPEVRALLKDESPTVRWETLDALEHQDVLTQDDLAGLLDDPYGPLAGKAAKRLGKAAPWGETAAAAARRAVQRAIKGEIPAGTFYEVMELADVDKRPGGFTPEEWVDLFGATWAPGFPMGAAATAHVREKLLRHFFDICANRGFQREMDAWVLRGVETIPSADGVVRWIEFWNGKTGTGAREAWIRAAASPDARVRALAYGCIARSHRRDELGRAVGTDPLVLSRPFAVAFPYIAGDLQNGSQDLWSGAASVAYLAPNPSLEKGLRARHAATGGETRKRLLGILVKAVGKGALDAVKGDTRSPDPEVRAEALGRLVITLGESNAGVIQEFLAGGGLPSEVAALWNDWEEPPPLDLLRGFLASLPEERMDSITLSTGRLLSAPERWKLLDKALRSPNTTVRARAATYAEEWRMVEAIPVLSSLLDDTDSDVRQCAQNALEALRIYIDLKASAARIGKQGGADTFGVAEEMLKSDQPLKRKGAVLALAALGDKAAIPILLKALDDPDPSVQEAALGALERLGGKPPVGSEKKD
jgi:HEAT repeat protein